MPAPTVPVIDPMTSEIRHAAIFVALLGASNYTFCDGAGGQVQTALAAKSASWSSSVASPAMLVPDNLKSGVNKVSYFDLALNPSYCDPPVHYATAVVLARPYRPKEKAKAEVGVLLVERWASARLRN